MGIELLNVTARALGEAGKGCSWGLACFLPHAKAASSSPHKTEATCLLLSLSWGCVGCEHADLQPWRLLSVSLTFRCCWRLRATSVSAHRWLGMGKRELGMAATACRRQKPGRQQKYAALIEWLLTVFQPSAPSAVWQKFPFLSSWERWEAWAAGPGRKAHAGMAGISELGRLLNQLEAGLATGCIERHAQTAASSLGAACKGSSVI